MKTNAVRLLDTLGIAYELREYVVDPDDLAAESVAQKLGMPPEQVFKTLVVRGAKTGICLAVIPGNTQLDLKALAKLAGDRNVETVPLKEVQPLTGYIRGGVTALACKKDYPVYIDELNQRTPPQADEVWKQHLLPNLKIRIAVRPLRRRAAGNLPLLD